MNSDYSRLENKIGYTFKDKQLLMTALTHTSFANEHKAKKMKDNERLEFLGDAVLEMASSEFLYINMEEMPEGDMTKLRASLVCEPTLAMDARQIGLEDFLYLGNGEEATGGRKRDSIISDAFEALIGAIFLDGGIEAAKNFILQFALNDIENKRLFHDSKTILQERINMAKSGMLSYQIVEESGPDHNKSYKAVAKLDDKIIGEGVGHTKKAAEQQAAYSALKALDKRS
ncbi:MAG: ribonuclease III [Eubacterium sp.]|nr:ribonuclease III [Eubacterium sp.]